MAPYVGPVAMVPPQVSPTLPTTTVVTTQIVTPPSKVEAVESALYNGPSMTPVVATPPHGQQVAPLSISSHMEIVWHGEFDRLFSQFAPHQWSLLPTENAPSKHWSIFKDSAKVRFYCQQCCHAWTSMKGRVVFWYHLNYPTNSGYVMFKLFGQQCNRCNNGTFEHAMWYPEEVIKVIGNVYNRIGQMFYGFVRPPLRIDRRIGKPRNQHNSELCQACKEGICREEWV